ncbi:MAG: adaptor protein MecA [Lachnospiraceae bacterium]|jgi:adapter protein MecA 1/2|nr:adaptor protein MecA [Lachnospiraceae bacterium]
MRIEKVNDTQIRCTLTKEDLAERQIKLSELAYGSEKAKTLFHDMIQQAAFEFGFEAENIPLMIEAIPLSTDAIILIITKVECPEELDTRFSQFSPASEEDDFETEVPFPEAPLLEGAEDILRLLNKLKEGAVSKNAEANKSAVAPTEKQAKNEPKKPENSTPVPKLFVMNSMNEVEQAARVLAGIYSGDNNLYHNTKDQKYYLFLHRGDRETVEDFNKICNILSEYAKQQRVSTATEAFFAEHFTPIIAKDALQTIEQL